MTTIVRPEPGDTVHPATLQVLSDARPNHPAHVDDLPCLLPANEASGSIWKALSLLGILLFLVGVAGFSVGSRTLAFATILGFVISGVAHVGNRWLRR